MEIDLVVGLLTSVGLSAIAVVHLNWARGGLWPATAQSTRYDKVTPPGMAAPGPVATYFVAGALAMAAGVVGARALGIDQWIVVTGTAVVVGVLALRAAQGFLSSGVLRRDSTYARLDRRYYSPLCLALAAGSLATLSA